MSLGRSITILAPLASLASLALTPGAARAATTFEDWTFYAGDPHVHTGVSGDGGSDDLDDCVGDCGDLETVFLDARVNGLDWVGVADHVNGSPYPAADSALYANLIRMALDNDDPDGGFVTVPSAEIWVYDYTLGQLGHYTVELFGDDEELDGLQMSEVEPDGNTSIYASCDSLWEFMDALEASRGPVIAMPHHPAAKKPMPVNWGCFDRGFEPVVEVYSGHGNSLSEDDPFDPLWSGVKESGTVHYAMDPDGYARRMGFAAGSDIHDTHPGQDCRTDTQMTNHPYGGGITMVVLPSEVAFERGAIYDAMQAHHTYATSGPRVPVIIEYRTGGVPLGGLGDELGVPVDQSLDVELRVDADYADAVTAVELVYPDGAWDMSARAGQVAAWTLSIPAPERPAWVYAVVTLDGDLLYDDGCDDGGDDATEKVWLSPSWIEEVSDDLDDDGVSYLDGDCDESDAEIHPGATEVWYDGVDQDCDGNDDDRDLDGSPVEEDCDDGDPRSFPGAPETWYDGVDEDCDGDDDMDRDADGWDRAGDCDDLDPAINPAQDETWYDGVDQDCDGNDDDQDGDGAPVELDCDDLSVEVYPGAPEVWYDGVDEDCAGGDDFDQDLDGWQSGADCDDTDAEIHPGATEVWYDGVDGDCDGADDDDRDGDGWQVEADCDDGDEGVHPDAAEIPDDGIDQDCDGDDGHVRVPKEDDDPVACAVGPRGGWSGLALIGLALVGARRRR